MALPKGHETPEVRALQDIVEAAHETELMQQWPLVTAADYALFGQYIVLFSYIDLNLRRIIEAAAAAGIVKEAKSKASDLSIEKVESAIQALPGFPKENKRGIAHIATMRTMRNLLAHFAVRRFPKHDAYCFLTKSAEDFRRALRAESEPNVLMTAVIQKKSLDAALSEVVGLEKWISYAAAEMVKAYAKDVNIADLK